MKDLTRFKMVCPHCKSEDIDYLADAAWNSDQQKEEVEPAGEWRCNNLECSNCNQDIEPLQLPLPYERRVCATCESDDIWHDAISIWDESNQEWVLGDFMDMVYCNRCDGETYVKNIKVNP